MADGTARSLDLPSLGPEHRLRLRVVGRVADDAANDRAGAQSAPLRPPTQTNLILSRSSDLWGVGPAGWLGAGLLYGAIALTAMLLGWQVASPEPWPVSQAVFKLVFEEPSPAPAPTPELAAPEPPPPADLAEPAPARVAVAPEPLPVEIPKPPRAKPLPPRPRVAAITPPVEPVTSGTTEPQVAALSPPTAPVVAPRPVSGIAGNPAPEYPMEARRRGFEGKVVLRVEVSAAGRPLQVTVLTSSGHSSLDQAALDAVERWRFEPATQAGQAVAGAANVPVQFRLED